jgi:hypothetical protein
VEVEVKKGDLVYAAAINYGGGVVVETAVVTSAGEKEIRIAAEGGRSYPGHAFNYGSRLHRQDPRLASSRAEAIERLVDRCLADIEGAEAALARAHKTLATAEAALAAEAKP